MTQNFQTKNGKISIKWINATHFPQIVEIETHSAENFWVLNDFRQILKRKNTVGIVALLAHVPVGFCIYQHRKNYIDVINLVVDPEHRRSGVGSTMLRYLKDIVAEKVKFVIRESNTSAHYFMKANSFKALKVRRSYFMDQHSMDGPEEYEDGYVFAYSHVISNMDEPIVAWSEV